MPILEAEPLALSLRNGGPALFPTDTLPALAAVRRPQRNCGSSKGGQRTSQ